MKKYEHKYGIIEYHDTPWNSRVIGGDSLEIDSVMPEEGYGALLLEDFSSFMAKEGYRLFSVRIDANEQGLKKMYAEAGFHVVEHTLEAVSNRLDTGRLALFADRFPVAIEDYCEDDITQLKEIARSEFRFGRFFEDPFIDAEMAQRRNDLWIEDLVRQGATIKVSRKEGRVIGFIAYFLRDGKVNLVLGGVRSEFRFFAYSFWTRVLLSLKDFSEIRTLISSSNLNVINLYSNLGFRFDNPQFGLHKHIS